MTLFSNGMANPTATNTRIGNTTATVVVASANQPQEVAKLHIANVDGSAAVVAVVDIYNGTTAHKIANALSIAAAGGYVEMYDILLNPNESLRVTSADVDGQLHVHAIHSQTNVPAA